MNIPVMISGEFQMKREAAFDLAALALQADKGNWHELPNNKGDYFDPTAYMPPYVREITVLPSLDS